MVVRVIIIQCLTHAILICLQYRQLLLCRVTQHPPSTRSSLASLSGNRNQRPLQRDWKWIHECKGKGAGFKSWSEADSHDFAILPRWSLEMAQLLQIELSILHTMHCKVTFSSQLPTTAGWTTVFGKICAFPEVCRSPSVLYNNII